MVVFIFKKAIWVEAKSKVRIVITTFDVDWYFLRALCIVEMVVVPNGLLPLNAPHKLSVPLMNCLEVPCPAVSAAELVS